MFDVTAQEIEVATEELVNSPQELEAAADQVGTFENADDPQAIGTVIWTVRTARARC
jgi:hypothetical protein